MVQFSGPPNTAIRNKAITPELKRVLEEAATAAGIDAIFITSGGQDALGEGTRRTGSTRHDRGRAADIQCSAGSRTLTFTNQSADPILIKFITAAAAAGATGIGAAKDYMGDRTMHVGFGTSPTDLQRLTWGRAGSSANAPQWLRDAAAAGWNSNSLASIVVPAEVRTAGRYVVIARDGLRLRGGPGIAFAVEQVLPLGTEVTLVAVDHDDPQWGQIDLEGDGALDGYVNSAFLAPAPAHAAFEDAPEPDGLLAA